MPKTVQTMCRLIQILRSDWTITRGCGKDTAYQNQSSAYVPAVSQLFYATKKKLRVKWNFLIICGSMSSLNSNLIIVKPEPCVPLARISRSVARMYCLQQYVGVGVKFHATAVGWNTTPTHSLALAYFRSKDPTICRQGLFTIEHALSQWQDDWLPW